MASKSKRKKLDLYWPTVLLLSIGVLLGAVFLGKYIGESFISGNSFKTAQGDGNSSYSPEIKTLSKPTIVPQNGNMSYEQKENSAIILPPSFKVETKYKQTTSSSKDSKETPVAKKEKPVDTAGIKPTPTPVAVSTNNKTSAPVSDEGNSGKTSSDIDKMIGTSSQEQQEETFERVELNEEQGKTTKSENSDSYKVQAGYYVNKDNASKMADDLSTKGYDATVVQVNDEGKTYYRVQAGAFENKENAKKLEKELEQNNYDSCVVTEEKHQ